MNFRIIVLLSLLTVQGMSWGSNSVGISALGLGDGSLNIYYQHQFNFDGAMYFHYTSVDDASLARGLSGQSLAGAYKFYSQNYGSGNYLMAGAAIFHAAASSERTPHALPILVIGKEWKYQHLVVGVETGLGTMGGTGLIGVNLAYELP